MNTPLSSTICITAEQADLFYDCLREMSAELRVIGETDDPIFLGFILSNAGDILVSRVMKCDFDYKTGHWGPVDFDQDKTLSTRLRELMSVRSHHKLGIAEIWVDHALIKELLDRLNAKRPGLSKKVAKLPDALTHEIELAEDCLEPLCIVVPVGEDDRQLAIRPHQGSASRRVAQHR